ncbi:MAG TPA: hypothetical protein VFE20_04910 [Thermoleophilia bacterium]|nr:hypothetical protein [Thermoleophilia bacterium]
MKRLFLVAFVVVGLLLLLGCGDEDGNTETTAADTTSSTSTTEPPSTTTTEAPTTTTERETSTTRQVTTTASTEPEITRKDMTIQAIEAQTGVVDADYVIEDDQVSLALMVASSVGADQAKELGENFVRLVKTSIDDPPGAQIGPGKYDYLIGVYGPGQQKIVMGAKVAPGDHITW